jgi:hypothetical protein
MEGKTNDWLDVFMRNKFGSGGFGQPVFRNTFRREFHVSPTQLAAVASSLHPIVVGMDNGLTAAAVVGQMDARGGVNILGERMFQKARRWVSRRFWTACSSHISRQGFLFVPSRFSSCWTPPATSGRRSTKSRSRRP